MQSPVHPVRVFEKSIRMLYTDISKADVDFTSILDYAIENKRYKETLCLAQHLCYAGIKVNLSKRWHWIRALSVNTGFFEQTHGLPYAKSEEERLMLLAQIAILRLAGPQDETAVDLGSVSGPIVARKTWKPEPQQVNSISVHGLHPKDLVEAKWFEGIKTKFRIIEDTPGIQRERVNISPARYFASSNNAIALANVAPSATHHRHPVVPNLHYLKNVFYPEECIKMISAAESVGFLPDIPVLKGGMADATRAMYFYWVIDEEFYSKLWSRVERFVPNTFAGKQVRGINRWFRLYKYVPGQEFPAHFGKQYQQVQLLT